MRFILFPHSGESLTNPSQNLWEGVLSFSYPGTGVDAERVLNFLITNRLPITEEELFLLTTNTVVVADEN